jgi:TonB family protein
MLKSIFSFFRPSCFKSSAASSARTSGAAFLFALALALSLTATAAAKQEAAGNAGGITEAELKQLLVGKALYLRGGYLDNSLSFNEHGVLNGHSPQGSYTLSSIEIEKVRLSKRKVELLGARYALHFLGALPYEDPTSAVDRVRITPKKKLLKITIDREAVVKEKKVKDKGGKHAKEGTAKAEVATAPAVEQPAEKSGNAKTASATTSPEHATKLLKETLDRIFAQGLDERMMAAMPDFWKLYYQAAAAKTDFRPTDPTVLRQNTVDKKARLLTTFEPGSNEYAQANGIAGIALYHAVIGADGKPGEIAVARPIGFGLDEGAVEAIRNAKFEPAMKDGKPAQVMLDLVVEFRIYSKRTATGKPEAEKPAAEQPAAEKPTGPVLPGPYSVQHP